MTAAVVKLDHVLKWSELSDGTPLSKAGLEGMMGSIAKTVAGANSGLEQVRGYLKSLQK